MISSRDVLLQMQSTLMNWLDGSPDAMRLGLPDIPVAVLLQVWVGLRYAAQRAGNGWHFHHIPTGIPVPDLDILKQRYLTLIERGCLYATAFRGLLDWPRGFCAYLDAYRLRPDNKEKTGLRREFGVLQSSWLRRFWKGPAFDFVQAAYNDYLVAHVPAYQTVATKRVNKYPELLQRVEYLSIPLSAKYLRVSTRILYRLAQTGYLTIHRFKQSDGRWLSRRELDQLQRQWRGHLTTAEAACLLGVSCDIARGLLAEHLLQAVPANGGVKHQSTYIYRDSLQELIQKLKRHITIQTFEQQCGVSLVDACIRNGGSGLGSPQLLKLICAGSLSAYHPCATLFPLNDLWFSPEVVENFASVFKEEQGWMSLTETQACLGVKRGVLHHLVTADLLHPVMSFGPKQFFRREDVLALRDRSVSSEQAAALLNIPVSCVSELALHKVLSPISGPGINGHVRYRFDRSELARWHKQYVLLYELKRLFGPVGLLKSLKAHHIKPLSGPPAVYLRKEVMDLIGVHMMI
jgi:hypothetical protein